MPKALLAAMRDAAARCEAGPRCMTLRIHNTLTRATERFTPIEPGHVRLYVCGITIYDLCHMGHARFMIAFDVAQRWLKTIGYRVTYVRNITDIDDKIIRRALERGISIRALTEEMIEALQQDTDALGLERPTHQPRATQYVPQMLEMIAHARGRRASATAAANGDVNFAVRKFPGLRQALGQVDRPAARRRARRRPRRQGGPARLRDVEVGQGERARRRQVAEPVRPRPAGLAHRVLGDVQGAARRALRHPRRRPGPAVPAPRERDRAERGARAAAPFANVWMHNGLLNDRQREDVEVARQLLHHPRRARSATTARRSASSWCARTTAARSTSATPSLDDARSALRRLYTALDAVAGRRRRGDVDWNEPRAAAFRAAMNDDFNTPIAVSILFELAAEVNRSRKPADARAAEGPRRDARRPAAGAARLPAGRAPARRRPASPSASRRAPTPSSARDFAARRRDPRRARRRTASSSRTRAQGTTWVKG